MPICPQCREEYEAGVTQCFDCAVSLVDSADDLPSSGEGPGKVLFTAGTEEELEKMEACLKQWQIPYSLASDEPNVDIDGHGLLVPPAFGDKAAQMLLSIAKPAKTGGSCSSSGCASHETVTEESALLKHSLGAIARMGESVIDELIELIVNGNQATQRRAALALSYLGPRGIQAIVKLLKVALEKERIDTVTILLTVLRQTDCVVEEWREFLPYLQYNKEVRMKALEVIGHLGELEAFDRVLPLLSDPEPEVRDEADNTLCLLSDEDVGFESDASMEEQLRCVELWKEWWARRSTDRSRNRRNY